MTQDQKSVEGSLHDKLSRNKLSNNTQDSRASSVSTEVKATFLGMVCP